MGDINQQVYLEQFLPRVEGPVLEVGSKEYGSTSTFRKQFSQWPYVGVDMQAGLGVDQVIDLVEGVGELPENSFALVICCSVLEHVTKPWKMAENLTRLLHPQGRLFISVPWVWRYHAYPDDYFRFSFRGIMQLFPDLDWEHIHYSTTVPGEFLIVKESCMNIDDMMSFCCSEQQSHRKYLPYLMVNMLGSKRRSGRQAA